MNGQDTERLAKLLGMLGSQHDGEVLAAARKCCEFLRSRNLQWRDVLGGSSTVKMRQTYRREPPAKHTFTWREKAMRCSFSIGLRSREREFLENILLRRSLTEKQQQWLDDIYDRLNGEAA